MKFTFSVPSLLAHTSAILVLGFSIPLVAPTFASSADGECKITKPPSLKSANDFVSMGHYQEGCLKDSQAAVASFTQAINLDPKAEEPYYHRANAYAALGNYQAAVADYTEVIKTNTGENGLSLPAYWNRARAYEKLGEKQKAISDWTQVINGSNSPSIEAQIFRANMYRDLGDKENAIADYKVADNLLQQGLNGVFGNGLMDEQYEKMFDEVRKELSRLGVSQAPPQLNTRSILQSITKIEVERALNLTKYTSQHPMIQKLDAQLQDLYKQLANTQPQPYKDTVKTLVSNAAYEKIEALEKERAQLIKQYTENHPTIVFINEQKEQLETLFRRNRT